MKHHKADRCQKNHRPAERMLNDVGICRDLVDFNIAKPKRPLRYSESDATFDAIEPQGLLLRPLRLLLRCCSQQILSVQPSNERSSLDFDFHVMPHVISLLPEKPRCVR